MTQDEAEKVVAWCLQEELIRPDVRYEQGRAILTWVMPISGNITTDRYKSARFWCMFMKTKNDAGVIGYWRAASKG